MCNTQKWMEPILNDTRISALTIPGTHDSATYNHQKWYFKKATQCQDLDIQGQLNNGIRFLDIRLKLENDELYLYHGPIYLELIFETGILKVCQNFLQINPSETILMSVKDENSPTAKDQQASFYNKLTCCINKEDYKDLFYTGNKLPSLGEVRGKIVLFRRFALPEEAEIKHYGLNIYDNFPQDNSAEFKNDENTYYVQDAYKSWNQGLCGKAKPENKYTDHVRPCLDKAGSDSSLTTQYLNFSSATGKDAGIIFGTTPKYIAEVVNDRITQYLADGKNEKKRFGIIITDFPTSELIKALIKSNKNHG